MSRREKILAVAIGLLLVGMGGLFYNSRIRAALQSRRGEIGRLKSQAAQLDRTVRLGETASKRIADLERRSLPAERALSRSLYQSWLLDLVGKIGLEDPQVRATGGRAHGDIYYRLTFSVTGRGNLEQLVRLMHEFYSIDDLHQIRRLGVRPIPESRDLDLSFSIEALVLPGAERNDAVANVPAERLVHDGLEPYAEVILGRNLFAPPNQPPQLSRIGSQEVNLGRSLSLTASAKDPDKLDRVSFRLGDDAPAGATIGESSGSFGWSPEKLGEYAATIYATDDGTPNKSASETIRISVVEPPPPPPHTPQVAEKTKLRFDDAKHTYVTAITTDVRGRKQLWLTIRTSGQILKLYEGDAVSVGSVRGVIRRIDAKQIQVEADEKILVVSLGNNLLEADELPAEGL
jgi:hypothetical protein